MTEELINSLAKLVEGENNIQNILIFTLSTCMWCKRCKTYLKERSVQYRYIDMDLIDFDQKSEILDYLRKNYNERVSYPFMICDDQCVIGYDPNRYDQIIKTGGK